jgi:hypothetical protein
MLSLFISRRKKILLISLKNIFDDEAEKHYPKKGKIAAANLTRRQKNTTPRKEKSLQRI